MSVKGDNRNSVRYSNNKISSRRAGNRMQRLQDSANLRADTHVGVELPKLAINTDNRMIVR